MRTNDMRGIVSMLGAVLFFSMMDACLKQLVATYSPMQVTFFRGVAGLPFVRRASACMRNTGATSFPCGWRLHVLRGFLSVLTLYTFVYAVSQLSLGDAYSIFLAAPLIVTALSAPMLKEHVGWRGGSAICGRPGGRIGRCCVRAAPASTTLGGRGRARVSGAVRARRHPDSRRFAHRHGGCDRILDAVGADDRVGRAVDAPAWIPLQERHWIWVLLIGVIGACGQLLLTDAFRRCEASVVAPFEYSALLWGVLLDWVLWQVLPSQRMLFGSAIVIGSGLFIIWRERRLSTSVIGPKGLAAGE